MTVAVVKLATLRELIDAKSVRTVSIVGGKGGWAVSVRVGQAERVLAGKDGAPRRFARLDTAARQLLDLGLVSFEVHGAYYEQAPARSARPDRSAAMKAAHSYGVWLKREVEETQAGVARGDMPVLSDLPFRIAYEVTRTRVRVLRIKHTLQMRPERLTFRLAMVPADRAMWLD